MQSMKTIRNLPRLRAIVTAAAKFGFGEAIRDTKLGKFLDHIHPDKAMEQRSPQERFRLALESLGPTFMKLGQVLSMRPDIIPPAWSEELKKLQDDCPPVPWPKIAAELQHEYGCDLDEVVASIDEKPLAAGSIGQVHEARTKEGRDIVLKVLRPGIDKIVHADLQVMSTIVSLIESRKKNMGVNPREVLDTFAEALDHELDLSREAENTRRMAAAFKDDDVISFPEVIGDLSTKRVLAIEKVPGTELTKWRSAGWSDDERLRIVENGAHAVIKQTLELGFFHADPHPGNIFVLEEQRLCFIDCGMVGRVDDLTRRDLAMLLYGISKHDLDSVMTAFLRLGDVDADEMDDRDLREDMQDFIGRFAMESLGDINMGNMLNAFLEGLRKHNMRCPGDLVLLIKALVTIEGVGKELAPQFDLVAFAKPTIERLVKKEIGPAALKKRSVAAMAGWAELVERLPRDSQLFLDRLRHNRLRLNMNVESVEDLSDTIDRSARNMSWAMVISAIVVGSSILVLANRGDTFDGLSIVGLAGYLAAATLGLWRLWRDHASRK